MEFRTIKEDGQVQEEIKKSRFICHAKRVYSEEEARDFITAIKKEHYKATHNCSAFIVGERSERLSVRVMMANLVVLLESLCLAS